uniref:Uncharacterized protein n=1 Tax=Ciona savignyi TaxID=51511 RepID=H2Z9P3_CIOSA
MQALEQPTLPTNATKQIFFLPPPLNDAPNGFGKIRMFNLEPPQPDIPKYSPNENIVQYNDNNETPQGSPSLLVTILVPVASLMILLLLTFSARRIWVRHHKVTADKPITNCDLGESCPETEPLQDASMQIVQETNQNSAEINNETDEHKSITYTNEKMERRPDTLKFLAASVAFQNSTVKAFKRLPYTPDPDYMLNGDNNAHCVVINESKDNITPLTKPKTRMKPRGLLERRGSNVALTISLKAGEKPNPN